MIAILSPAKNMRIPPARAIQATQPLRMAEAQTLFATLHQMPAYELESTMKISPSLALKAAHDFQNWKPLGGFPAIFAYAGLAYQYLSPDTLTDADLQYAQQHLRHISALYGALRPLDEIQPYRLEMAQKLRGLDLYQFWNCKIHDDIYKETDLVINLASSEYSKAISKHRIRGNRFLTCEFLTEKNGKLRCLAANAKMARGAMARYLVTHRIDTAEQLTKFAELDFVFEPALSNDAVYTFIQRRVL